MLKKLYDTLVRAVGSELWQTTGLRIDMTADEVDQLMQEANFQTVDGLVANALVRNNVPIGRRMVVKAMMTGETIIQRNKQMDEVLRAFVEMMDAAQMPFVVVKGQTLNALYPVVGERVCGDIDFWIRPTDYSRCRELIMQKTGCLLPERMLLKETGFKWRDTKFELHTRLVGWSWPLHSHRWNRLMEESMSQAVRRPVGECNVPVLAPKEEIEYTFLHAFFHLLGGGIGLRQMCDIALLLHHHRGRYDGARLMADLRRLGVERAFRAFAALLTDYLSLPPDDLPTVLNDSDRRVQRDLVEQILIGGNFGKVLHKPIDIHRHRWRYKLDSMRLAALNAQRYYRLAPMEAACILPARLAVNIWLKMNGYVPPND